MFAEKGSSFKIAPTIYHERARVLFRGNFDAAVTEFL